MSVIDRLMTAVLTGYTRNLHMLGLNVTSTGVMRELRAERRSQGLKGEPSQIDVRDALVNKILLESAKMAGTYQRTMLTAGGQMAYLRKEMDEAKNMLGKEFLPAFGRAMRWITGGLKAVQEHPGRAAEITALATSAGSGLSAAYATGIVGSMLGFAVSPMWRVPIALGAGLATYVFLTWDQAEDIKQSGAEAVAALKKQKNAAFQELSRAENAPLGTPGREKAIEMATAKLHGFEQSQKDIRQDMVNQLGETYAKKIAPLQHYEASVKAAGGGVTGEWASFWEGLQVAFTKGVPQPNREDRLAWLRTHPGQQFNPQAFTLHKIAERMAGGYPQLGISTADVEKAGALYQEGLQFGYAPGGPLLNQVNAKAAAFAASFEAAGAEIEKLKNLEAPLGKAAMHELRMYGSPEEKIRLAGEQRMAELEDANRPVEETMAALKSAKPGTPEEYAARRQLQENLSRVGGQSAYDERVQEIKDIQENNAKIIGYGFEGLAKHTEEQIIRTKAAADADAVRSRVVQGDYSSKVRQ
jgi:hypothetical protein